MGRMMRPKWVARRNSERIAAGRGDSRSGPDGGESSARKRSDEPSF
jgi:hypothetical protein